MAANLGETDPKEILLDPEKAYRENYTPFGRKLGVVMEEQYGLYRIKFVDGKNGDLPESLMGKWTTYANCESDMKAYIRRLWDFSNSKAQKANKPLASNATRQHQAVQ